MLHSFTCTLGYNVWAEMSCLIVHKLLSCTNDIPIDFPPPPARLWPHPQFNPQSTTAWPMVSLPPALFTIEFSSRPLKKEVYPKV